DHQSFQDLKRNVLTRIFEDVRKSDSKTYGRLAGDISEFVSGKGRELAKALYDEATLNELTRFANVMRTLTPESAATNPSRSGQTVMRRFNDAVRRLAPVVGLSIDGFTGMLAGIGLSGLTSMRSASRA